MRRATLGLAAAAALGGIAGLLPVAAVAQDRAPEASSESRSESRGAGQPAELATLVADALLIDAEGRLTATGSVEAFYGTARLRAAAITYDPATERLQITGPITLVEGDGATIVLASAADLSTDMTEGLLQGARLVLDRQMQVAAQSIQRTQGRYTRAARVRASSCEVCAANPVPLWEIRATSVVHDEVERQLYFDNAQFRVIGIPVFWLPYLRAPDPTLDRSRGFLAPSIRTTSGLGTGIKLPYFIPIGQSRDLTVTPYVSTNVTRTVELRYRQAFRAGDIEFRGSLSRDDLEPGETRGALFGTGSFDIGSDFRLNFGIEAVTDDAYISDYGLGDSDRLESFVEVTRTRRNDYVLGRLIHYDSLREGEDNSTLPTLIGDFTWVRRFAPAIIGGEGGLTFQTHSHLRTSDEETDANGDGVVDGRDVARATIAADWRRNWIADNGMIFAALTELTADVYEVRQDPAYDSLEVRVTPAVGAELRWPFLRPAPAAGGAAWVVEPVVQVAWSPGDSADDEVPNEDSVLVEFDEGNLFSLDRFPGADAHEAGLRANVGFTATRHAPRGASLAFALGRVVRTEDLGQFNSSTGLDGATSDWLLAAQYDGAFGLTVTNRALFDDDFDVSRNELRLIWSAERYSVGSSFIWLEPDLGEQRPDATSQLAVDAAWDISTDWAAQLETRYDFEADRAARAGLGLQYSTECVTLDLSLSRRFTSSTSVRATTDFDLAVVLNGFGSGNRGSARRACGG